MLLSYVPRETGGIGGTALRAGLSPEARRASRSRAITTIDFSFGPAGCYTLCDPESTVDLLKSND